MASIINATTSSGVAVSGDTSGVLQLATNGGTTAVTIDTSQNVGIGTTSPGTKFQVTNAALTGTTVGSNRVGIFSTSGTGKDVNITFSNLVDDNVSIGGLGGVLYFLKNSTETMRIDTSGNFYVGKSTYSDTSGNGFGVFPNSGVPQVSCVGASNSTNKNFTVYSSTDSAYKFYVDYAGTGYYAGNLLVGTTSAWAGSPRAEIRQTVAGGWGLSAYNATSSSGVGAILCRVDNTSVFQIGFYYNGGNQVGTISTNGTGTTYGSASDYRLKENVQPIVGGLAKVAQLNPVSYNWISNKTVGEGFIAHELQAVVPDAVSGDKDAVDEEGKPIYQNIDAGSSSLIAILVKAIQEQQALITTLQTQVAELKQKVGA